MAVAIILLYPVGIILTLRRLSKDSTFAVKSRTGIKVAAVVLLLLGLLIVWSSSELDIYTWVIIMMLWIPSACMALAISRSKIHGNYQKYMHIITKENITSIDAIVFSTGLPYEKVVHDLETLIRTCCLINANVDKGSNTLVINRPAEQQASTAAKQARTAAPQAPQAKVVTCRSCGANSTVTAGEPAVCEYCGSPVV